MATAIVIPLYWTVHPVVSWESLHVHPLWERNLRILSQWTSQIDSASSLKIARLVIISHWLALIGQGHCIYNSMTSKKDPSWDSDAQAVLCHRILKESAGKTWHCRGGNFGYACLDFRHPKPKHVWIFLGWHPQERNLSFNDPSMSLTTWKQSKRWQSNLPVITCLLCGSIFSQTFEICWRHLSTYCAPEILLQAAPCSAALRNKDVAFSTSRRIPSPLKRQVPNLGTVRWATGRIEDKQFEHILLLSIFGRAMALMGESFKHLWTIQGVKPNSASSPNSEMDWQAKQQNIELQRGPGLLLSRCTPCPWGCPSQLLTPSRSMNFVLS